MKQGYLIGILLLIFFTSCNHDRLKNADVSDVKIGPIKILRLDQDVFLTKPDSFETAAKKIATHTIKFFLKTIDEKVAINH